MDNSKTVALTLILCYTGRNEKEIADLRTKLEEARKAAISDYICAWAMIDKAWAKYDGCDAFIDFVMKWLAANREDKK